MTSVCTRSVNPPFLQEVVWTSYPIFNKGDLSRAQFLEGVAGKEVGDIFQGEVAVFT